MDISIVEKVRGLHAGLRALPDLKPGGDANALFGELVFTARTPMPKALYRHVLGTLGEEGVLADLHALCAEGESALERHWGALVAEAQDPYAVLRSFPYWNNYRKLAAMEVKALRREAGDVKRVLFAGSGPMPLTAFMMQVYHGIGVTNVEIDGDCHDCAAAWMNRVLGQGCVSCHHMDIMDFEDFSGYDVVVLAALVGLSKTDKQKVLAHLARHMRPDQVLMVRSVRGMRQLLYPVVEAEDMPHFRIVREVHPRGEVINSVLLARKIAA